MRSIQLSDLEIVGTKGILVKLEELSGEEATTDSGIIIPEFVDEYSESGRPEAKLVNRTYTTVGVVMGVSDKCKEILESEKFTLEEGDTVLVVESAVAKHNWLILDRYQPVADFKGFLLITPQHIEAKLKNCKDE